RHAHRRHARHAVRNRQRDGAARRRLYLYSDGIYEIHRPDGSLVTLEEFVAVLESGRPLPQVVEIMHALLPPEVDFDDDVALLEVAIA
uniref:SpoIIE family protein phosphatase n=1 Tax=Methylogaea oryzae TaxID=1295382 RepID=UPI0012E2D5DB